MNKQQSLEDLKQQALSLARRYMTNAEALLEQAGKQNNKWYIDSKYVRIACGAAYCAVLIVLDCIFLLCRTQPWPKEQRKHIGYYRNRAGAIDSFLLELLNSGYNALHLCGYYDGNLLVQIIRAGFDVVYQLIDYLEGTPIAGSPTLSPVPPVTHSPVADEPNINIAPAYVLSEKECRRVDRHCRRIARRAIRRHYTAAVQDFFRYRFRREVRGLFCRRMTAPFVPPASAPASASSFVDTPFAPSASASASAPAAASAPSAASSASASSAAPASAPASVSNE